MRTNRVFVCKFRQLARVSNISTESPTPDNEGLHVVRRDEPEPNLLYTAVSRVEPQAPESERPERFTFFTLGRVSVIVGIVLFIGSLFASRYLIQQLHREAGVPEEATPSVATSIAPTAAPSAPKAFVPIAPDMLHVTSISLGDVRLTVVNSKQLAEGDWLPVTTPDGIVQVRVAKIDDGIVHFEYDGKTIDARLTTSSSAKKSP